MIERIFPKNIRGTYSGSTIAKWAFLLITILTIVRSLLHIFLPDGGAQTIATIPLGEYSSEAEKAVIHIFALWGLSQLIIGLFYLIVFFRYSNLIPLMYIFIFIEYSARLLLTLYKPFEVSGVAPGAIGNYILIPLSLILFILAITPLKKSEKIVK